MTYMSLNLAVILTIMVSYMQFPTAKAATAYVVGGAHEWTFPRPNFYEEWSRGKKFMPYDKFYFNFKHKEHTLVEVDSKAEYDTCNYSTVRLVHEVGGVIRIKAEGGSRLK
ncbi:hypothetical protein R6Q59_013289 [Mikania micrantha]